MMQGTVQINCEVVCLVTIVESEARNESSEDQIVMTLVENFI